MIFDPTTSDPCPKCGALANLYATVKRGEQYVLVGCCEGCVIKNTLGEDEFERRVNVKLAELNAPK